MIALGRISSRRIAVSILSTIIITAWLLILGFGLLFQRQDMQDLLDELRLLRKRIELLEKHANPD
jgi:hypothetical protein